LCDDAFELYIFDMGKCEVKDICCAGPERREETVEEYSVEDSW
jgi:hypothetical protein